MAIILLTRQAATTMVGGMVTDGGTETDGGTTIIASSA